MKFKHPFCTIRKDLNNNKLKIPIWDEQENYIYIHGSKRGWRYRWLNKGVFQIKYNNKYYNAYSIVFDFINPEEIK